MSVVGVIPARGGSKGIARKNVLLIQDKPVIGYVIEAALAAATLDHVVVSTDDTEIASVAESYGVSVIMRPMEFATDAAPIDPTLRHVVQTLEADGLNVDLIVWLQANVPTTRAEVIDRAVQLVRRNPDASSAQTVIPYRIPPQWAWRLDGDHMVPLEGCYSYTVRRQESPPSYHLDGSVNVLRRDVLMNTEGQIGQAYFGENRLAIVLDSKESVEIDEPLDLEFCRFLFSRAEQKAP